MEPPAAVAGAARRAVVASVASVASVACGGEPTGSADPSDFPVALELVADGLDQPTDLAAAPGDERIFVTEQVGRIRVIRDGALRTDPFLDISDRVTAQGERGLLGLAFDPGFADNRRLYVNHTGLDGTTRVESYLAASGDGPADPTTGSLVISVAQPFANHNGGQLAFGPDGMLYVGLGDGGSGGDPQGNGQDLSSLLGTILRLDVSGGVGYVVPDDNPYVGVTGARPEIWHHGLRNPWRFSFSSEPSLLVIADVGQSRWEEIDAVPATRGGVNFGWAVMEGAMCYSTPGCDTSGLHLPAAVYSHDDGCSVTGGYVYEGSRVPELTGRYVYADFCSGWLRALAVDEDGTASDEVELPVDPPGSVTSFGRDSGGELYVLTRQGAVYKLVPAS